MNLQSNKTITNETFMSCGILFAEKNVNEVNHHNTVLSRAAGTRYERELTETQ